MRKKILSFGLSLALLITVLSSAAFAASPSAADVVKAYKAVIDSTAVWGTNNIVGNKNKAVAFYDMDGDTLPEMFIGTEIKGAALTDIQVWTYRNGAAKQAGAIRWGWASVVNNLYSNCNGGIVSVETGSYGGPYATYYTLNSAGVLVTSNTENKKPSTDGEIDIMDGAMSKYAAGLYLDGFDRFFDVPANQYYAEAVKWAVENEITNGTGTYSFSPDITCTRAQIITLLWRAAGSPLETVSNPFTDIKATDYYYNAAVWASKNGMVRGTRFDGDTPCTRSSTVTYIWQSKGSPSAETASFIDVPTSAAYSQAVAWAVRNGITNGTGNNQFSPDTICSRGQIVTFLYRARNVQTIINTDTTWSDAYKDFVFTQEFLSFGQSYASGGSYIVALYDMDKDGTPELKIDNGESGRTVQQAYIYTYADGEIVYLGIGPTDAFYDSNGTAGIYGYYRASYNEIFCNLYSKNGLSIDSTSIGTYTDATWPSNLKLLYSSTVDGIRNEGWSVFVDKSAL